MPPPAGTKSQLCSRLPPPPVPPPPPSGMWQLYPPTPAAAGLHRFSKVLFCLGHISHIPDFYQQPPVPYADSHLEKLHDHLADRQRQTVPSLSGTIHADEGRVPVVVVNSMIDIFRMDGHEVISFSNLLMLNLYCSGSRDCLNALLKFTQLFPLCPISFPITSSSMPWIMI